MIFFCFAVQDRLPIINDFYHFLQNFGLNIWYDRRNIFFGDHRYQTNIQQGAANPQIRYAVVFYSQQFPEGNICLEEFRILEERHLKGELHIFPIFLGCVPNAIPDAFILCKQLVYKILSGPEDFYRVALHILAKITSDQLQSVSIQKVQDVLLRFKDKQSLLYQLLREYDNIGQDKRRNWGLEFKNDQFHLSSSLRDRSARGKARASDHGEYCPLYGGFHPVGCDQVYNEFCQLFRIATNIDTLIQLGVFPVT